MVGEHLVEFELVFVLTLYTVAVLSANETEVFFVLLDELDLISSLSEVT